jgi:hypothetical protein
LIVGWIVFGLCVFLPMPYLMLALPIGVALFLIEESADQGLLRRAWLALRPNSLSERLEVTGTVAPQNDSKFDDDEEEDFTSEEIAELKRNQMAMWRELSASYRQRAAWAHRMMTTSDSD